jgi:hypothetical protein
MDTAKKQQKDASMLFIGSCRYMYDFPWNSFLGRLHTTKEIIFALKHINVINPIRNIFREAAVHKTGKIDHYTTEVNCLEGLVFGDLGSPALPTQAPFLIDYTERNTMGLDLTDNVNDVILEISSRKIYTYETDEPMRQHYSGCLVSDKQLYLNNFYLNRNFIKPLKEQYNYPTEQFFERSEIKYKRISKKELEKDLILIKQLIEKQFKKTTKLHVIPHLNLKKDTSVSYIKGRAVLVKDLRDVCRKLDVRFYDVGKYLEEQYDNPTLKEFMPGAHYSKGLWFDKVKEFLIKEIIN